MSFEIKMKNPRAVANVINHLGTGVPKEMALRELVINGIEACLRNPEESSKHGVWVVKDHQYRNKLSVVNAGGDFLSQEVYKSNLATLGNTGNITIIDGVQVLDSNKGIGAKIAYLPKAGLGLVYRSVEAGEEIGIMAQMCKDESGGTYHLPAFQCEFTGELTSWPMCDSFSPHIGKSTGTEVVAMGNKLEDDTWFDFDRACSARKGQGDGGTGYGIFRYLTHRLWDEPQVPVRVSIYNKSDGTIKRTANVKGLKNFMQKAGCSDYGTVELHHQGMPIIAHWSIIKDAGSEGYSSNWSASGYTAIAWKGEVYSDLYQHHLSIKKDLNDCGVIVKYNKVMVIFEIPSDVELCTNAGRTELYKEDRKIDKGLLHELFRENFPERLSAWQEENQISNADSEDLLKQIRKDVKNFDFGVSSTSNKGASGLKSKTSNGRSPKKTLNSRSKSNNKAGKKINAIGNLNNFVTPECCEIKDPDAPLVEFHLTEYKILFNTASPLYDSRKNRILSRLKESCLVKTVVEYQINRMIILNAIYTIFSINNNFSDLPLESRKERWQADNLQTNWNLSTENEILKIVKRKNDQQKKAA